MTMTLKTAPVFLLLLHSSSAINVEPIGPPIPVWRSVDTLNKCGFVDVPDIPPRIFTDPNKNVSHIIAGSTTYRHMNGPSIFDVERSCEVAWNMTGNANPSMFAGNEFLDSTVMFHNGTVVALVHTEYPGDRYPPYDCPKGRYPYCWTVTMGLAVSHDFGNSWNHVQPPPNHLVATVPYKYNTTQLASGWGDPSNIVFKDEWYHVALWNRNQVGKQAPGICFLRTQNLLDPTSWRGYGGNGVYDKILSTSPYGDGIDDDDDIDNHICQVTDTLPSDCAFLSLSWSVFLESFVGILQCFASGPHPFQLVFSQDLLEWSKPQELYSKSDLPPDVQRNVTSLMYPAFIDPISLTPWGDPNYGTIGRSPYLFWSSLGHSPYTDGRTLWATPFQFSNCEEDDESITVSAE